MRWGELAMHTFNNTDADTKLLTENTELTRQVTLKCHEQGRLLVRVLSRKEALHQV